MFDNSMMIAQVMAKNFTLSTKSFQVLSKRIPIIIVPIIHPVHVRSLFVIVNDFVMIKLICTFRTFLHLVTLQYSCRYVDGYQYCRQRHNVYIFLVVL